MPSAAEQVDELFLGSDFGDDQLSGTMRNELLDRLESGRPLRVYAGYDPSKPDIHLGHSITLRKLRRFQEYGHHVIIVVGTFTALVGDTSDKTNRRQRLRREAVFDAAKSYAAQVHTILDTTTDIQFNHTWLEKLDAATIVDLASEFTVQQFQARTSYRERLEAGKPIALHEFLYALFQGYDAVHLQADVQIGATEQLFNIMAGRRLQRRYGQDPCIAITYPILVGTDGRDRMSKSKGNYVGLVEPPNEQYGKVMSISDETMRQWISLVAAWSPNETHQVLADLESGDLHPMIAKKRLARRIVTLCHDEHAATAAESAFESLHQNQQEPEQASLVEVDAGSTIVNVLLLVGAVTSRSAARRLVAGRGVSLNREVIINPDARIDANGRLRVGKRRFYDVVVRAQP